MAKSSKIKPIDIKDDRIYAYDVLTFADNTTSVWRRQLARAVLLVEEYHNKSWFYDFTANSYRRDCSEAVSIKTYYSLEVLPDAVKLVMKMPIVKPKASSVMSEADIVFLKGIAKALGIIALAFIAYQIKNS